MRILLVHNFYGSESPSGENIVFENEKDMLSRDGHEVLTFTRNSDEIRRQGSWGALKAAAAVSWNQSSYWHFKKLVDSYKPEIVHVHNTFPMISPSIFYAVGPYSATVLTLHNYRLFCSAAIPHRDGKPCTECIDKKSAVPAVKFGCYRRSKIASLPLAAGVSLHRRIGTWHKKVDAFLALSEFQKKLMVRGGLPEGKIFIKPNFINKTDGVASSDEREDYFVFVGRLSPEKGIQTLLDAWRLWGPTAPRLLIVGDGPLRSEIEYKAEGLPIEFLGKLQPELVKKYISKACMLVLPSECYETFGLVVIEAFSFGTPVAVSNLGSLPNLVENGRSGVVFKAGDSESLYRRIKHVYMDSQLLKKMGEEASREYYKKYTKNVNIKLLNRIYENLIGNNMVRWK